MLKLSLAFLVGLVCGGAVLLQSQRAAFAAEIACIEQANKIGYTQQQTNKACEKESDLVEFLQML
jgi:hypothetical protein